MRDLKRNQVPVAYRVYLKNEEIIDEYGNYTGQYKPLFGEEQTLLMSVSANKGDYSEQMFGDVLDYDRVLLISDPNCPIDENSRVKIGGDTYAVKAAARSLNVTQYAVKRVEINENNGKSVGADTMSAPGRQKAHTMCANRATSAESLRKAAAEVRAYKARVEKLASELVAELAAKGAEIALVEAEGIRDTGKLLSSIVSENNGNYGYVKCRCGYAVFVEFGTGIVGSGKPHPDISIAGWRYDVNGHGELGWWYPDKDGKMRWTRGMPSRPFMYNTAQRLRQLVVPSARGLLL